MDMNVINSWRGVGLLTYLLGYLERGRGVMLDYIECLEEDLQDPLDAIQVALLGQRAGPELRSAGCGYCGVMSHVACHMLVGTLIRCGPSPVYESMHRVVRM